MKKIYYYADPTGNITLLAPLPSDASDISREAALLMQAEPSAEQVGFLGSGGPDYDISLQMAGGEFCGNAALSAAALFIMNTGRKSKKETVRVSVSGSAEPVRFTVLLQILKPFDHVHDLKIHSFHPVCPPFFRFQVSGFRCQRNKEGASRHSEAAQRHIFPLAADGWLLTALSLF